MLLQFTHSVPSLGFGIGFPSSKARHPHFLLLCLKLFSWWCSHWGFAKGIQDSIFGVQEEDIKGNGSWVYFFLLFSFWFQLLLLMKVCAFSFLSCLGELFRVFFFICGLFLLIFKFSLVICFSRIVECHFGYLIP